LKLLDLPLPNCPVLAHPSYRRVRYQYLIKMLVCGAVKLVGHNFLCQVSGHIKNMINKIGVVKNYTHPVFNQKSENNHKLTERIAFLSFRRMMVEILLILGLGAVIMLGSATAKATMLLFNTWAIIPLGILLFGLAYSGFRILEKMQNSAIMNRIFHI